MTEYEEERLAELLAALPEAPQGWVQAAKELPRARAELDELVARAEADAAFRDRVLADLERAVAAAGVEPTSAVVESLRRRLGE
jgi:hypothetical protein